MAQIGFAGEHAPIGLARLPDAEACARHAAEQIAEAVGRVARHIALAGGSTPRRCAAAPGGSDMSNNERSGA